MRVLPERGCRERASPERPMKRTSRSYDSDQPEFFREHVPELRRAVVSLRREAARYRSRVELVAAREAEEVADTLEALIDTLEEG